ncbi:hypothetical protein ACP275_14G288700 [Erythranthe tilingii]
MMLGKRGRPPPMKRTTSMTEFTWDLNGGAAASEGVYQPFDLNNPYNGGLDQNYMASAAAAAPPRGQRRNLAEITGNFLRACSLCKRRLIPGRDIFMYRGDSAFCSQECRQQQMNKDERKDKCSVVSKMDAAAVTQVSATADRVSAV